MMMSDEDISELLEGLSQEFSAQELKDECQLLKELEPYLEFEDRLLRVFLTGALQLKFLRGNLHSDPPAAIQIH
jgi:hypothetical protein